MADKSFSLQKKIAELEVLEAYFRSPDIDLQEAISKHKQALVISQEVLEYLDSVESTFQTLELPTVEV
jgi:hypothetical protein